MTLKLKKIIMSYNINNNTSNQLINVSNKNITKFIPKLLTLNNNQFKTHMNYYNNRCCNKMNELIYIHFLLITILFINFFICLSLFLLLFIFMLLWIKNIETIIINWSDEEDQIQYFDWFHNLSVSLFSSLSLYHDVPLPLLFTALILLIQHIFISHSCKCDMVYYYFSLYSTYFH